MNWKWLDIIIKFFLKVTGNSPVKEELDLDAIHAIALLENRQRDAYVKIRKEKKSVLEGYSPPMLNIGNRIDLHMEKAGVMGKEKESRVGPRVKPVETKQPRTARK